MTHLFARWRLFWARLDYRIERRRWRMSGLSRDAYDLRNEDSLSRTERAYFKALNGAGM